MLKNKGILLSFIITIIALLCMGVNLFLIPFPDFAVRITGAFLLIGIFLLSFNITKNSFIKK
ncbi:MAG: hypothetical protein K0S41_12 [Anaerocolumna sp.]|jgi:hypothetical protein|nr:hypothetical protein [Anaerocolumna sp.]